ncbi:MAG: four-helix bundle copper-binding protein [Planctomycetes bacterium]|jgi:hypothetical protein|nr:four-helix bundle copper-binding protein [Planctomycetota bacterium]
MSQYENQPCIDACTRCAEECEHCAIACLNGPDVAKMAACIRLDNDCAAVCRLAATFLIQRSSFDAEVGRLCAAVCLSCETECSKHNLDQCQRCAEACRRCADECNRMAGAIS